MKRRVITIFALLAVAAAAVVVIFLLRGKENRKHALKQATAHYCFIADNMNDRQWQLIYDAIRENGEAHGAWVECMNSDLPVDYTREQLLEAAILSEPDGIFVEGGESRELSALIDQAVDAGIPVITLQRDCRNSKRACFVETGNFNLGREYARQIIGVTSKNSRTVLLVMSEEKPTNVQLFLEGLKRTLANEGNHLSLELQIEHPDSGAFNSAQLIRRRVLSANTRPDVIACFTDEDSINAHQVLVDYNFLDQVRLISSSTASPILHSIEDGSLYASVVTDAASIGKVCVDRMEQARDGTIKTNHEKLDATVIRKENVKRYLEDA